MLQLILSRAGYGKTEYVFSSIEKLVNKGESNILLITPEQFSFIAESRILKTLGEERANCVESTSFTRLASEILTEFSGDTLPVLSKGAKAVKMREAIEAVQDSLVIFNKNKITVSFINSVIKIYDEMKSCRVSVDDILEASENTKKEILKRKLRDVAHIIGAYDALIENEYFDPANELTRLYEHLLSQSYFKNRTVFIDGFSGFVAQEYKVLEVILKQADKVYITFCTDSANNTDKYDLFSYVNSNIRILCVVTEKAGVEFCNPILLEGENRFKNDELKLVEKYIYSNIKETSDEEPENISIYRAKNLPDECDRVALEISRLLRKGYKAREIAVICRDLGEYERELNYSFSKYNVPYFDDERQDINSQPLIMLVNFLLRCVMYSFRSEDIFSLLKTGLTALSDEEICDLENYVYLWNINGSAWKREFTKSTKGFTEEITEEDGERLCAINASREKIVLPLIKFQKSIKKASVKDICKAVYYALKDFSSAEKLRELAVSLDENGKSALASEQGRIWDMLMDILDRLAAVSGDAEISIRDFYSLFSLMIMNEDLGTVPIGLDNVQLGSADRIRCDNPRAVFVLGANDGKFPQSVISAGLFSESDRISLIENNFKLYSYGETLNAQEKYFAYMAVCSASEKLFVSYNSGGDNSQPSSIVSGIKAIFKNIREEHYSSSPSLDLLESDMNAFSVLASHYNERNEFISSLEEYFSNKKEYKSRLAAIKRLYDNEDIVLTDSDVALKLFKKNLYLSASRIEDYYSCAFRYFLKFGLGARPRKKAEMDPMQTGTVIHYVLERLLGEKGSDGLTELTDAEITLLVNTYLSDYLNNKMGNSDEFTVRFKYQFMRLSKMLVYVVIRLRDEFSCSDFSAKAFELEIGNENEGVKSRRLVLPDGGSIEIKGAIDRVDVFENAGEKYVRVVDYKSGTKNFRLSDILYGLNLQMFIYLFTLTNTENEYKGKASGVLYMHSSRSLFSLERKASEREIAQEEKKNFSMKGVVLNDAENEIAKHMEHNLEGKYIPVRYVKKNGAVEGNVVTLEELGRISRKIDELIINMGASLHSGKISQNPVNGNGHDKTCEFCDYGAVCKNRRELKTREIEELKNDEVIELLKEEQDA